MSHNTSASDAALEFAKHLITLSSSVVAFSATFVSYFRSAPWWSLLLLMFAWLVLAASVVGGLKTISSVIMSRLHNNDDWSEGRGERWARLSRWAFLVGLAVFAIFAAIALTSDLAQAPSVT